MHQCSRPASTGAIGSIAKSSHLAQAKTEQCQFPVLPRELHSQSHPRRHRPIRMAQGRRQRDAARGLADLKGIRDDRYLYRYTQATRRCGTPVLATHSCTINRIYSISMTLATMHSHQSHRFLQLSHSERVRGAGLLQYPGKKAGWCLRLGLGPMVGQTGFISSGIRIELECVLRLRGCW